MGVLGCLPRYPDPDTRRHRDSQTVVAISRSQQSLREYGTQMARLDVLIDETDDRHVKIRLYFTAAQLLELKRQKCAIIQRFYRGYYARKRAWGIRQRLYDAQVAKDEADRGGETFRTKNDKRKWKDVRILARRRILNYYTMNWSSGARRSWRSSRSRAGR